MSGACSASVFLVIWEEVDLKYCDGVAESFPQEVTQSRLIHVGREFDDRRMGDLEDRKKSAILYDRSARGGWVDWGRHIEKRVDESERGLRVRVPTRKAES
jgi:hypothetical protein